MITTWILYIKGHINTGDIDFTKFGTYGDFIGGLLGKILSIVAVLLVYRIYISQKRELELNREILEKQSFENTFFNMLKVHQELKNRNSIELNRENLIFRKTVSNGTDGKWPKEPKTMKGRTFFQEITKDFERVFYFPSAYDGRYIIDESFIESHKSKNPYPKLFFEPETLDEHSEYIKFKYDLFFETYANYVGDYFRNLYHILNFIAEKKQAESSRIQQRNHSSAFSKFKKYADIVQSQMSFSELKLLFYNAIKYPKMKKMVSEFDFPENLYSNNLLDQFHLQIPGMGKIKTD